MKISNKIKYYYLIGKELIFNLFNLDISFILMNYVKFLLNVKITNNIKYLEDLKDKVKKDGSFNSTVIINEEDDEQNVKVIFDTDNQDIENLFDKYSSEWKSLVQKIANNKHLKDNDIKILEDIIKNSDMLLTIFLSGKVDTLINEEKENQLLNDELSSYVSIVDNTNTVLYNKIYMGNLFLESKVNHEFKEQVKKYPYFYKKYKSENFLKQFNI